MIRRTTGAAPQRPRFGVVLQHAFETTIATVKREIENLLARRFAVEPHPGGLLIDGCVVVRWVVGFLRRDLVRHATRFTMPVETWDLAICIAVDPETKAVIARCFTWPDRLRGRRTLVWNLRTVKHKTALTAIGDGRALMRQVAHLRSGATTQARFLAVVGNWCVRAPPARTRTLGHRDQADRGRSAGAEDYWQGCCGSADQSGRHTSDSNLPGLRLCTRAAAE